MEYSVILRFQLTDCDQDPVALFGRLGKAMAFESRNG